MTEDRSQGNRANGSPRRRRWWVARRKPPPGAAPGTIVVDSRAPKPRIHVMAYGPDRLEETDAETAEELRAWLGGWPVTWVNVDGVGDADTLRALAELVGMHRLALEDVVNVHQRPKVEEYDDRLFVVSRMIWLRDALETEQISLFVGENFVFSFQERPGDCLDLVRKRIRSGSGRLRHRGADYLCYAILDAVTDAYFPVFERIGERIEELEDETVRSPNPDTVARIHDMKRDLQVARRAVWPMREMYNALMRDSTPLVTDGTRIYLRDSYDHTVQLLDALEAYREISSGLMDIYLSSLGNRTNEVMKVLTIMATIFIPLTFVAGIYGMNFDPERSPWNMPELRWYYGYPACLALMAIIAAFMLIWFRRRGWLGRRLPDR